jgi:hypothetical protein
MVAETTVVHTCTTAIWRSVSVGPNLHNKQYCAVSLIWWMSPTDQKLHKGSQANPFALFPFGSIYDLRFHLFNEMNIVCKAWLLYCRVYKEMGDTFWKVPSIAFGPNTWSGLPLQCIHSRVCVSSSCIPNFMQNIFFFLRHWEFAHFLAPLPQLPQSTTAARAYWYITSDYSGA